MSETRTAVCGFGKTGQALLEFLLENEPTTPPILYNDSEAVEKKVREQFEKKGVRFWFGAEQFGRLAETGRIILSPGFNGREKRFAGLRDRGIEIISEIEFAFRHVKARVIAVTGTNGKSTTVSLIHHLLQGAGLPVVLAGNIGIPFISQVGGIGADDHVVLEVSSFQLEEIRRFHPWVAALLNITPDHLDRYPSMEDYIAAKLTLFQNQTGDDTLILNADDLWTSRCRQRLGKGHPLWFSRSDRVDEGSFVSGTDIVVRLDQREERISLKQNPLQGLHNLENIMAAVLAVRVAGMECRQIEKILANFVGLPHRMQAVARIREVLFINDSKATNVDAALKSILSIDRPLVVILGGKDKGGDFQALETPLRDRASRILLIGKAAPLIAKQLKSLSSRMTEVKDMKAAVEQGFDILATSGGVVLLAPGCASFDMFDNFEHRGDVFAREAQLLQKKAGNG